jgi:hypothetical protein
VESLAVINMVCLAFFFLCLPGKTPNLLATMPYFVSWRSPSMLAIAFIYLKENALTDSKPFEISEADLSLHCLPRVNRGVGGYISVQTMVTKKIM